MQAPFPRWVAIVVNLLGIVLCFGCLIFLKTVEGFSATVRGPGIAVWVHTPHVEPGDRLTLEVGVYGGRKAAIDSIVVRGEGIEREVEGEGKNWGGVITTKSSDVGQDTKIIEVTIPKTAPPGEVLMLEVASTGTFAETTGFGTFSDRSASRLVEVPIDVLSPGQRLFYKALSLLRALGTLAVVTWIFSRAWHPVGRLLARADKPGQGDAALGPALGIVAIALLIMYCLAGVVVFGAPLRHATELVGDWWSAAAEVVWIAVPPFLGRKWAGPGPSAPSTASLRSIEARVLDPLGGYREGVAIDYARCAGLEKILAALGKIPNARVKHVGKTIEIFRRKDKETVWLELKAPAPGVGDIVFSFSGIMLALDVAVALHTVLGPFEITIGEVPLAIDGTKNVNELASEWASGVSVKIQGLFGN